MSDESSLAQGPCPKCGASIPPDAPQGLCPRCVLAGTAHGTEAGQQPGHRLEPPALPQVAAAFPELEILECIGAGGMGVVYKARQTKLDRFVALKLLPLSLSADPTFAERFHREARFLARLNHPNIVSVYDFGQAGGFCFLLMEYVDGVNLRQAMQAGRFSPSEALALVPSLCSALQYAHDQGVLHRDIKPENILLDAQGRVKLADFGIAKMMTGADAGRADITLTQSGSRLGTPHYMAPEQIEKPSQVDHRADIYSLGVVCYELLTGELPLGRFAAPSEKADLDSRIDAIVMRALAKEREQRQQSAGEVRSQVEGVAATPGERRDAPQVTDQKPSVNPPPTAGPDLPRWATRFAAGLNVYIVVCLVAGFFISGSQDPSLVRIVRWPMELLLLPTVIALRKRRIEWRFLGLTTAALLLACQIMGAFMSLLQPSTVWTAQSLTHPNPVFAWTATVLQLAMIAGCLWTLSHRDVLAVFDDLQARPRPATSQQLWHRVFWGVAMLTGLPLAAVLAFIVSNVLIRAGHEVAGGTLGGLIAAAAGGGIFAAARRTRPTPAEEPDAIPLNPWPHRTFWWLASVVLLTLSGVLLVVVRPQLAQSGGRTAELGLSLLPLVVLGWMYWGYRMTRPGMKPSADSVRSDLVQRRQSLFILIPTVFGILVAAASLTHRGPEGSAFTGGPATSMPSIPTAVARPPLTASEEVLHLKLVSREASDSEVKLAWDLIGSRVAAARLTVGDRTGMVWLEPAPQGGYVNRIEVRFMEDKRVGAVLLSVGGSGGNYPQASGVITMPLKGDATQILAKANETVTGDLELTYNTPVWIAFSQFEQIRLEVLPNLTPNGSVDGLPVSVSAGGTNAAAMKWHNAWLTLEETRKKAEVGVVAPRGFEMLAAERDLAVAEAEFRARPLDAALAESRYAQARADILQRLVQAGKATEAEWRDAAQEARQKEMNTRSIQAIERGNRLQSTPRPVPSSPR